MPEDRRKSKCITFWVTEGQKERISAFAADNGMKVSRLIVEGLAMRMSAGHLKAPDAVGLAVGPASDDGKDPVPDPGRWRSRLFSSRGRYCWSFFPGSDRGTFERGATIECSEDGSLGWRGARAVSGERHAMLVASDGTAILDVDRGSDCFDFLRAMAGTTFEWVGFYSQDEILTADQMEIYDESVPLEDIRWISRPRIDFVGMVPTKRDVPAPLAVEDDDIPF